MYTATTATQKIMTLTKRLRGVSGGTSASKTISILLWLIDYAQTHPRELISVVSESFPHLRRGVERDFLNIMHEHNYFKADSWNKSDHAYTFETESIIEFFSADQPEKVKGARRDVLFINEANNVPFETFNQLEVRTKKIIWLDWNPVSEFWWYTDVMPHQEHDFITLSYKDNEALDQNIVQAIESRKHNANWWRVYGEGLLGEAENRIYKDWLTIDEVPHEARLVRYGLDFGYTNDPAVCVAVYEYNGGYVLDEIFYRLGMSNRQIAEHIKSLPYALVVADSAEPKSIDEIQMYGVGIVGANKGKDSINHGIQLLQDQRVSVTKRSTNVLKEYRNYLWMTDKNGKIINEPEPGWDHGLDAVRYVIENLRPLNSHIERKQPSMRRRLLYTTHA